MLQENKLYCPRCEMEALQSQLTPTSVEAQVEAMGFIEGFSAPSTLYKKRLSVCKNCPALIGGVTCSYSGSLAAYKAAMLNASCPNPEGNRWQDL